MDKGGFAIKKSEKFGNLSAEELAEIEAIKALANSGFGELPDPKTEQGQQGQDAGISSAGSKDIPKTDSPSYGTSASPSANSAELHSSQRGPSLDCTSVLKAGPRFYKWNAARNLWEIKPGLNTGFGNNMPTLGNYISCLNPTSPLTNGKSAGRQP